MLCARTFYPLEFPSLPNQIPDTHCTKPIALAKGTKSKNPQACGTKYQMGLLTSKKKALRKAAEKSYCMNTPVDPQELYYECRYSDMECVSSGIAEASGQAALMGVLLAAIFGMMTGCLGIPEGKGKKGKVGKGNIFIKGAIMVIYKFQELTKKAPPKPTPEELEKKKLEEEEAARKALEPEEEEGDLDDRVDVLEEQLAQALERLKKLDSGGVGVQAAKGASQDEASRVGIMGRLSAPSAQSSRATTPILRQRREADARSPRPGGKYEPGPSEAQL